MAPKYNTWIRFKKMLLFVLIFFCIIIAACFITNIWLKILLLAASIPFGYISIILLLSHYYFSEKGGNYQAIVHDKLASKITAENGTAVLDIGAGSGSLSIKAAKTNKLFAIKAIDYWGANWGYSIKQCIDNATIEGVDQQIEFIKASASKLPFDNNTFDIVISCLTFHEVQDTKDKNLVIAEALRVLKSGGCFIFFDLFYDKKIFGDFEELIRKIKEENVEISEIAKTETFLDGCPKILLHKRVLGHGALVVGRKTQP